MAVKHTAEVTVYDVTDIYGVTLTNEAATFKATSDTKLGTAATATTRPQAFQGAEAVACGVTASIYPLKLSSASREMKRLPI